MAKRRFDAAGTLDALLGPAGVTQLTNRDQLSMLSVHELSPTPYQPRTTFDETSLADLAESIRVNGVLQPLLVRRAGAQYEIVAGERRWRAAQMAGVEAVPVYVREFDDQQAAAASAVENLMREDLNPVEEVEAKRRIAALALGIPEEEVFSRLRVLLDRPEEDPQGVTQLDQAFQRLGGEKWQSFLKNKARILNLPGDVKQAIRQGLDYRKALVIGGLDGPEKRAHLLQLAEHGATVQVLRDALKPGLDAHEQRRRSVIRSLSQQRVLNRLSSKERTRVEKLLDELERILAGSHIEKAGAAVSGEDDAHPSGMKRAKT
ncbi:ParB/RepB/Spo0J family partition protein (plasmid) [Deinococcus sp. KNUC1210]|uniref:ParB/RepB/Spo0J family partition protein n=1 Tax=Deinococcus sp. KNUC1210 TaxID=2917691 RepID=UPI001EF15B55|nr:ParB/RepB/Spo0J family partition protein [Deinococcus sp. KNUC1210]ULH17816.1 ParB/RepB/Spo0J family partition protein [Deinococcus sp. KNUC1210]